MSKSNFASIVKAEAKARGFGMLPIKATTTQCDGTSFMWITRWALLGGRSIPIETVAEGTLDEIAAYLETIR